MEIKPFSYISKQYWMISCLNLRGIDLEVYSIIFGFSQDGSEHQLSLLYFTKWLRVSNSTVRRSLASLSSKGLIRVRSVPGKFSFYSCEMKPIDDALRSISEGETLARLEEELRKFDPYGFGESKEEEKRI